jgi:beta-glucosidase
MVMTAFNTVNGIPNTDNQWLIEKTFRDKCGFEGILIADYAAIKELLAHGIAEEDATATKGALKSTVNIDM